MCLRSADGDITLGDRSRLLVEIKINRVLDGYRLWSRCTLGREFQLFSGEQTHGLGLAPVGGQSPIKIRQPRNTTGRIDHPEGFDVHVVNFDGGCEWSLRSVVGIDGTGLSRNLRVPTARQLCRQFKGEL